MLIARCWVWFPALYSRSLLFACCICSSYADLFCTNDIEPSAWGVDIPHIQKTVYTALLVLVSCLFIYCILLLSHSVMTDSLPPHGQQHARPPYPSPTPGACLNSCPLSPWCHPTITSSVCLFSSCLQSVPPSGSSPMSWLFGSGGQKNWSFSLSISPSSEYSGLTSFRIDWFTYV